jgi:ribosomal protein S12 methylthiotransferase accessory factor
MINKQNMLRNHYQLKNSIKRYKGKKVKSPEKTVNEIYSSFEKIGLRVKYDQKDNSLIKKFQPFSIGNSSLHPLKDKNVLLMQTLGKGITPELAKASATAKLIERFSGYGILENGVINCYLSTIKLNSIWKKKKNELNENLFPFHSMGTIDIVPNKYKKNYDKLKKSICYCLTDKKLYTYPEEFITKLVGSNGLASGNTLEEATLHAIFELLERLGCMYVLDNLPKAKKIEKSSVNHESLKKLMKKVTELRIEYDMFDFSYIFDIPLIVTIFNHKDWNLTQNLYSKTITQYPKIIVGVETDPQEAALICFTDFLQGLQSLDVSIRDNKKIIEQFRLSKINLPVNQKKYLRSAAVAFTNGNKPVSVDLSKYSNSNAKEISIDKLPNLYDINQKVEIERIVKKLKNQGFEIYIEDITHPDLEFPVVRAILSGGEGYFNTIPLNGYAKLVLDAKNKKIRYSRLNKFVETILTEDPLQKIIMNRDWIFGSNTKKLIDIVISEICCNGIDSELWGVPINKFYFIGMMYLRKKRYEKAENCFSAALNQNQNDIPSLIGMAYIYSKRNSDQRYNELIQKIKQLNDGSIDIDQELESFDELVIDPNPFEPCNGNCQNKINSDLCKNCFFNYVPEKQFMRKHLY